jgi:hypothetical protein
MVICWKHHFPTNHLSRNQKAAFTNKIKAGTSTSGPITPANACPLAMPKTAIDTAMASSKLFPAAVKDIAAD